MKDLRDLKELTIHDVSRTSATLFLGSDMPATSERLEEKESLLNL